MFLSNPSFVLAILAASFFLTLSVSADGEFTYYGGYPATTDVEEIATKDLIQKKFQDLLKGKDDGADPDDFCVYVESAERYYLEKEGTFLKELPTYTSTKSRMMNMYENYYEEGYATLWVSAALEGGEYQGNNFGDWGNIYKYPCTGRQEAAMKGTAYLGGFLEVNQYMEQASAQIEDGCIYQEPGNTCMEAIKAWNKAAAFYVGSLEGPKGDVDDVGNQIFALGNNLCDKYMNCGGGGDKGEGVGKTNFVAKTNIVAISLFQKGAGLVLSGDLEGLQKCIKEINAQMLVMFVQGTLRYAHKVGVRGNLLAKELGEAATFAAALLPQLAAVNTKAAKIIQKQFLIGQNGASYYGKLSFDTVHLTLACNYYEMGISCSEVGTLVDKSDPYWFKQCDFGIPQKNGCRMKKKDKIKFKKICGKYMPRKNNRNEDAPFKRSK